MKIRNPMKLSDKTISVLKNFSSINQSILFKEGSKLRTISLMKNILAEATVTEEFSKDFGIYDLNQFLNGLSVHQSPELILPMMDMLLFERVVLVPNISLQILTLSSLLQKKRSLFPVKMCAFELSTAVLEKLLKAAAVYQVPDLSAIGENGVVKLVVRDKKNDTSHGHEEIVGETDSNFTFNFKIENIKVLPGTYDVVVSQKLLSRFTSKNHDLTYYIALEPDSTFG